MILDTTSKTIEVVLGGAVAANQLEVTADWVDTASGLTFAPGGTSLLTNGATAVTAVASPAANLQRQVKALTVYNADTANAAVTVRMFDGSNHRRFVAVTLTPGQSLVFTPEEGWAVLGSTNGQIPGTTTNDNAAAGNVGEFISSTVLSGSAVSLSNVVAKDITNISLTPGDWDVWGNVVFSPGGVDATAFEAWTSGTSATAPTRPNNGAISLFQSPTATGSTVIFPTGMQRVTVSNSGAVNFYLSCLAAFSSTMIAYGFIGARRRR